MKRKNIFLIGSLCVLLVAGGGWFLLLGLRWSRALANFGEMTLDSSGWKNSLPKTATDVHEWARASLPSDYSYYLKARINEGEFQKFVSEMALSPHADNPEDPDQWLSWDAGIGFKEAWWDPTPSTISSFAMADERTWTFAKYENGFLYFKSLQY